MQRVVASRLLLGPLATHRAAPGVTSAVHLGVRAPVADVRRCSSAQSHRSLWQAGATSSRADHQRDVLDAEDAALTAASARDADALKRLVCERGAHVLASRGEGGVSSLHAAVVGGNWAAVEYVRSIVGDAALHETADSGESVLHAAARLQDPAIFEALLKLCGQQNPATVLASTTDEGRTAAHVAAAHDNVAALGLLREACGDDFLWKGDKLGMTVAHVAILSGATAVLSYLADAFGNEPLTKPPVGHPLDYALVNLLGSSDQPGAAVGFFTERFGREYVLGITNNQGDTIAHAAARRGNVAALEVFDGDEDFLKKVNANGLTVAHAAVEGGGYESLGYIERRLGQDFLTFTLNPEGSTPAFFAAASGSMGGLEHLLRSLGSEALDASCGGMRPIEVAAAAGHANVVRFLAAAIGRERCLRCNPDTGMNVAHVTSLQEGVAETVLPTLWALPFADELFRVPVEDGSGMTCAHVAAGSGNLAALKFFEQKLGAAYLAQCSEEGLTVAHTAAMEEGLPPVTRLALLFYFKTCLGLDFVERPVPGSGDDGAPVTTVSSIGAAAGWGAQWDALKQKTADELREQASAAQAPPSSPASERTGTSGSA